MEVIEPDPAPTASRPLLTRARDCFRKIDWQTVALILAIKALLMLFAAQSLAALWDKRLDLDHMWSRWDAVHYLNIAAEGYRNTDTERFLLAFFPLYPWLILLGAFVVRDYFLSAMLVSGVASITAGLLLQKLASLDTSPAVARMAVWFLFIFPTSYFLHIGYTESLFLTLTIGCFLAARTERWALAGVLGVLACLTRVNGLLLVPPLAIEAWQQFERTRKIDRRWAWIALIPSGFAVYLWLNYRTTGDWFAFLHIQREHFFKELTWPWIGLHDLWLRIPGENATTGSQEFIYVVIGFLCTIWCWLRLRPSYSVWMTLNWLLITSTSFVLSVPRYTIALFPIFILAATAAAARHIWYVIITVWSLLFLGLFISRFVQGLWAF